MDRVYRHTCEKANNLVIQFKLLYKAFSSPALHILSSGQLITLAVEVGKLATWSKVERDFLLKVPKEKPQLKICNNHF